MIAPKTILIKSDGNELTFMEVINPKPKGETQYIYRYSKSETKLNTLIGFSEIELTKLIKVNT